MKLLNVFPFKAGDKVVQVPVRGEPYSRQYVVISCQYGKYGWSEYETSLVSIANIGRDVPFGTYPCDWFRKVTDETAQ